MTKEHNDHEMQKLKDAKFIEKYYWLFNYTERSVPFYKWLFLEKPQFKQLNIKYDEMSQKQKLKRVLLALEKVNHANPNNFTKKEQKILTPTRAGSLNKMYQLSLAITNSAWIVYTLSSRSFNSRNIMMLASFTLLNQFYLLDGVNISKEFFRYRSGLKLARQYLEKYEDNMKPFANILHPLASHHDISHI